MNDPRVNGPNLIKHLLPAGAEPLFTPGPSDTPPNRVAFWTPPPKFSIKSLFQKPAQSLSKLANNIKSIPRKLRGETLMRSGQGAFYCFTPVAQMADAAAAGIMGPIGMFALIALQQKYSGSQQTSLRDRYKNANESIKNGNEIVKFGKKQIRLGKTQIKEANSKIEEITLKQLNGPLGKDAERTIKVCEAQIISGSHYLEAGQFNKLLGRKHIQFGKKEKKNVLKKIVKRTVIVTSSLQIAFVGVKKMLSTFSIVSVGIKLGLVKFAGPIALILVSIYSINSNKKKLKKLKKELEELEKNQWGTSATKEKEKEIKKIELKIKLYKGSLVGSTGYLFVLGAAMVLSSAATMGVGIVVGVGIGLYVARSVRKELKEQRE